MAQVIGSKQTAGLSIYVQRWQRWQSDIEKNTVLVVEKIPPNNEKLIYIY